MEPCQILYETEYGFYRCGKPSEGMDDKGVLVCRGHGEKRNMVGGTHVGWFADNEKEVLLGRLCQVAKE